MDLKINNNLTKVILVKVFLVHGQDYGLYSVVDGAEKRV